MHVDGGISAKPGQLVDDALADDANSIGALHGSARGARNIVGRITAMARLGDLSGEHLLDVGCGTGEYTTRLAASFDRVDAIDIEHERLDVFRAAAPEKIRVHTMSVNELEFDDATFDTVTMIEVLEHLSDIDGAMREIHRVLRPGGQLLLTTPNRYWPLEQHGVLVGDRRMKSVLFPGLVWIKPLHKRMSDAAAFTRSDLEKIATRGNFALDGVTYMMPPLDSLGEGHKVHGLLDKAEATRAGILGQTIVGRFVKR